MTTAQKRRDACHIVRAAVQVAQYGRVTKALFRGPEFYLEFEAAGKGPTATPLGVTVAILDVMQTMADRGRGLGTALIRVRCHIGGDRHDVRTPTTYLENLLKYSQGKRELLTANIIDDWVRASRYKRRKGE